MAQIVRSRGRIGGTVSQVEADLARRSFGANGDENEPPPAWLVEAVHRELPEFRPAAEAGFTWERVCVYEGWRPDESVPHTDKAGCAVALDRYLVIPPVGFSHGPQSDGKSMTVPMMLGGPQSVMIRLGVCEACRHLLWGV